MHKAVISATGLFTPQNIITNDELVESFNAYVDIQNSKNAKAIELGEMEPLAYSSSEFIEKASGIKQRYVIDKEGVLDPNRMYPKLRKRSDDEPSLLAEMSVKACHEALERAQVSGEQIDAVIVACSNLERAYPALAVEVQHLLGAQGFAFDVNVACSSATFGIQAAADMVRSGSARRAIVVSPEVTSGHLEWRDRDCHFIFGDVATAVILERAEDAHGSHFEILSMKCATVYSNNIRNNNGFLRRCYPQGLTDQRDMQFMQNGRKVFKEVVPLVSAHIADHFEETEIDGKQLKRIWLHQANQSMNDLIGRKVFGRVPEREEQPNILQDYANTSSAGSIIAFHKHSEGFLQDEISLICSFGAGYSVGSVLLKFMA